MISELFINAAVIIAAISIGNQILINEEISPSSPLKLKVFFGVTSAGLGIILMNYHFDITSRVIFDQRNMALILSASYCGYPSVLITGLLIGLYRLLFQGITMDSILAALNILMISVCSAITSIHLKRRGLQWLVMSGYALIFPAITFVLTIRNHALLQETIIAYCISTILASIIVYRYLLSIDLLRYSYQNFRKESSKDYRTGLNNVRQFDKEFNKLIQNSSENGTVSMLFIDIDYFKKINDVYGHQNGDEVLKGLGKILLSTTSSTDIVSRNGGEEFSVLMTDCPHDKVLDVAERIRKTVQDHKFYLLDGRYASITVSIGVAIYPYTLKNIEELPEKADLALYKAKRTGRNKVVIENEEDQSH